MIESYLNNINIKQIEFIILTHFHNDHYGNIKNIISNYTVRKLYLKRYYGLDGTTSSGYESNDEYIKHEFENYNENLDVYKIHDTCLNIPIKFKNFNKLYNCVLLLEKELSDIERINTYKLSILNHSFNPFLYDLHIYEKTTGKSLDLSKYLFNFYLDNYADEFGEYIEGYDAFREYLKSYFKIFINSKNDNDEIDDTCNLEIIFNVSWNKNFYWRTKINSSDIK